MRSICVFCGSSPGDDPAFVEAARRVGEAVALSGRSLVFGGGKVGLMGALADAALAAGGRVIGVIPSALSTREVAHQGVTTLHVVSSMHARKAMMADLADGFLALPGGLGTLEELFEVWTWGQLGLHQKPCGILEVEGFYGSLLAFVDSLVVRRFVKPEHRAMLFVGTDPEALMVRMSAYTPPGVAKWIDRSQS